VNFVEFLTTETNWNISQSGGGVKKKSQYTVRYYLNYRKIWARRFTCP